MSPIAATAIPAFLDSLSTQLSRPQARYLVPTLVATSLGRAQTWLPSIYHHATSHLPPAPAERTSSPLLPTEETNERRVVVREIKESLLKGSILFGVPKAIEALLELGEVVEPGAKDDSFVREELETLAPADRLERGRAGLGTIYQGDLVAIFEKMGDDMRDVRWMSQQLTYGSFLTPLAPPTADQPSRDPLAHDPALLSVVTLSCLIPQRTPREILWHLRGALRRGIPRDEVEELHKAIERVCEACGLEGVGEGMPRVTDVEVQKEEKA